ncbi:hypothetical protein OEZ85_011408 [Tetradesmus obliquus]|uniref:Ig-like domain-containing protein n=1 Tax=Tetradesmus obliquus TaxID=3088 RepID=A0ABY8TQW6_TETOB|nr:hypothetical protein OEZ85_011408 [Tetradesmus obliquus]
MLAHPCVTCAFAQAVEGACCTFGQPTYKGAEFNKSSFGVVFQIATCSDGPCTDNATFNYLVAGSSASESPNPQSCCDVRTNPNNNFWYNPQAGTGRYWWMTDAVMGGPYLGTGKTCNPNLLRWQCSIGGVDVPTCQDTDPKTTGPQPYTCPSGYQLDAESTSSILSTATCCKLLPVPSPSPAPKPAPAPGVPSPAPIPGAGTCGDADPGQAGDQPFDCAKLGNYVRNDNVPGAAPWATLSPATSAVCCRPTFSCVDINPDEHGCQPFYCDTVNGWYPNQDAYFRPNPSNDVCCLRSTCADKDVFKPGKQPQRCPPGTEYDPTKANVSPPSRRRCCRAVPTCGDTQPSTPGADPWYCDPNMGLAQNPNAAGFPNPSNAVCCVPLERPTCGDIDISTATIQQYPCTSVTHFNSDNSSYSPPSATACCKATCADTNVDTAIAEKFACPSGQMLVTDAATVFPPSENSCCTMMPPPPASPSPTPTPPASPSPAPAVPSPSPAVPSPSPAVPSPSPAVPSPSPAVPSPSPAVPSPSPAVPSPSPAPTPAVSPVPTPTSPVPPPPTSEPTCGNIDPTASSPQAFQCPTGTVYNAANVLRTRPSTRRCCLPTCSDMDLNNNLLQPWQCPEGTVSNSANANFSPPSNSRCCLPTCSDRNVVSVGKQPWNCPVGTVVNASAALKTPPSHTDCCLPTCGDTQVNRRGNQPFQCPAGAVFIVANAMVTPPSEGACCITPGTIPTASPSPAAVPSPPPAVPSPPPAVPSPPPAVPSPPPAVPSPPPAVPSPAPAVPSPSPAPQRPTLSLVTQLPPGYTGLLPNATATGPGGETCTKEPAPVLSVNVTIANPGNGQCGTSVSPGGWTLSGSSPPTIKLDRIECTNTKTGTVTNVTAPLQLQNGDAYTCVLIYVLVTPSPSPPAPVPSPRPSPGQTPSVSPEPGVPTCGNISPGASVATPFDCSALGDYVLNSNMSSVSPPNGSICCMPKYSCIDINPDEVGCQPFICDENQGWYVNQNASYRPNPSSEVCCLRATCGDTNVYEPGPQPFICRRAGEVFNPAAVNVSPPLRRRCCMAVPAPSPGAPAPPAVPSPSPAPQRPTLSLVTQLPPGYTGLLPNATATGPGGETCTKNPAPVLSPTVTIANPGNGQCGPVPPGDWSITGSPPPAIKLDRIECTNTKTGTVTTVTQPLQLQNEDAYTCVLIYVVVTPSPSPAPAVPSPSPAPQRPTLSLVTQLPPGYTGLLPNATATGPGGETCTKNPAPVLSPTVTIANPGNGQCGPVPPGDWSITGSPPPAIKLDRIECTNTKTGTVTTVTQPLQLQNEDAYTCVLIYVVVTPSPSPAPAVPSPSPAPQRPTLSLVTQLPPGYTGLLPNATATGPGGETCTKNPAPVLSPTVTIANPGNGQCGTSVSPGQWTLSGSPPPAIKLDRIECTETKTGTVTTVTQPLQLQNGDAYTCVFIYVVVTSSPSPPAPVPSPSPGQTPSVSPEPGVPTCGDISPGASAATPFDCSTVVGDYVFNSNMSSVSPPTPEACCMPKYSCIDINPDQVGCQPFICDEKKGWYVNQNASYLPNPSSEICCLRATCGDTDVYKEGAQPQRCNATQMLDPSKLDASPPTRRRCCMAMPSPPSVPSPPPTASPIPPSSPTPPLPSPSPVPPGQSQVSLISRFPPGYSGPLPDLTGTSTSNPNDKCIRNAAPQDGTGGVTPSTPGASCVVPPGTYSFGQQAPLGTQFEGWVFYNTTTGQQIPGLTANGVPLAPGDGITAVAVYSLLPKLALISQYLFQYSGPNTANLTATGVANSEPVCSKPNSAQLGSGSVTVAQPGLASQCGSTGYVKPGTYNLAESPVAGTQFVRWEVYNTTSGSPVLIPNSATPPPVTLAGGQSATVVAVYNQPGASPAPPPSSPTPPLPSPSPVPPGQSQVSLISRFPPGYSGPLPDLTGTSTSNPNDKCIRNAAPQDGTGGVTPSTPGASCVVPPGTYSFGQQAPLGTQFEGWVFYNTTTGQQIPGLTANGVPLAPGDGITAVAVYSLLPKLALISQYLFQYSGPNTANLTATGVANSEPVCSKPNSAQLGSGSVTVAQPGLASQCGSTGYVKPGTYNLAESPVAGTQFVRWEVWNTTSGSPVLIPNSANPPQVTLAGGQSATVVAVYNQPGASPAPPPSSPTPPVPSPSPGNTPTPPISPEPSPSPAGPTCSSFQCPNATLPNLANQTFSPPDAVACCLPTCDDRNVTRSGLQQHRCPPATLRNTSNALSGPPTDELCCLPTCKDGNVTTNRINETWVCPPGFVYNAANDLATPPSDDVCCLAQGPSPVPTGPSPSPSPGVPPPASPGVPPPASPSPPPQLPSPSPPAQASPSPSPGVPPPASPTPSPSPAPGLAQLALLTKLPAGYPSPGADLNATSPGNDQCLKPSSPVEGRNSTSITSPGAGQCGNGVNPGTYTLGESPMPGLVFKAWQCYNTTTGQSIVTNDNAQQLQAGQAVTCVAEYELAPSPSPSPGTPPASPSPNPQLPSPSPAASPSPTPAASPSPTPSPLPRLALISQFPAGYTGPGANLSAISTNDSCVKLNSPIVNGTTLTPQQPGNGQCNGPNGNVQPGNYSLTQTALAGTVFVRWDVYDLTNNVNASNPNLAAVVLSGTISVTLVAVYDYAPSPSPGVPSPSPTTTEFSSLTLSGNIAMTCVAVYDYATSPSPAPSPLPRLALISEFPAGYSGPGANLTAVSGNASCVKLNSPIVDGTVLTPQQPGEGQCNGLNGNIQPGNYSLTQTAPAGTVFVRVSPEPPTPPTCDTNCSLYDIDGPCASFTCECNANGGYDIKYCATPPTRCDRPIWKNGVGGYVDTSYANKRWSCADGQCEGRCASATNTGGTAGVCPTSSCIANKLGTDNMNCPKSNNCPVRNAPNVTCAPVVAGCNDKKCLGRVFCPNAADCGAWQGVTCFYDGNSDNWKVCSSPECLDNPVNYRVKDKPAKDKECDRPPFKEGVGVGGIGFVDVGFTSNNPSYSCTGSSDCEGSCSKTLGVCPTSSCITNNLGDDNMNCPNSANCPVEADAICQKLVPTCDEFTSKCLGRVRCSPDNPCSEWEGYTCFYDGNSDNWKVCGAKACDGVPSKKANGRCLMPPWKNRTGTDGAGYIDLGYEPQGNKGWSCAGGQCEGRCATEDNPYGTAECPTSSCIANALGSKNLNCPNSANCPVRTKIGVRCEFRSPGCNPNNAHCLGFVTCPNNDCGVWEGYTCFADGSSDNWKICAATRQDGCANQPPLGPDEDDPQCKNQLPWACCTTGKNIPKDDRSQCTLSTCDAGTRSSDGNYCTDTSCLTYMLPASETDFTFYVADDRFVSELPWDPKPCGGEGASGLCRDKSKVCPYQYNLETDLGCPATCSPTPSPSPSPKPPAPAPGVSPEPPATPSPSPEQPSPSPSSTLSPSPSPRPPAPTPGISPEPPASPSPSPEQPSPSPSSTLSPSPSPRPPAPIPGISPEPPASPSPSPEEESPSPSPTVSPSPSPKPPGPAPGVSPEPPASPSPSPEEESPSPSPKPPAPTPGVSPEPPASPSPSPRPPAPTPGISPEPPATCKSDTSCELYGVNGPCATVTCDCNTENGNYLISYCGQNPARPPTTCLQGWKVDGSGLVISQGFQDRSYANKDWSCQAEGSCWGRCHVGQGRCQTSSCIANKLGTDNMNCPKSNNCPVRNIDGVRCKPLNTACTNRCLGTVDCPNGDCGEWQGVACFWDGSSDNFKVCNSPACASAPASGKKKTKSVKDKGCDVPPWINGTGGIVGTGKYKDYDCDKPGECEGECSKTKGCPTSSCIANKLGEENMNCPNSANCPVRGIAGAKCQKLNAGCTNDKKCLGRVTCENGDCPDWEGYTCFYDGSSDNYKVCSSMACKDTPNCVFRPWKNKSGNGGQGYVDHEFDNVQGANGWTCTNTTCEGRCSTEDNPSNDKGVCPTSSCIANGLGSKNLNCPVSANCPVRNVAGVKCEKRVSTCDESKRGKCLGNVRCPGGEAECGVWEGYTCFYDGSGSGENWKICAASAEDNCSGTPDIPPDEDDPQCVEKLPWSCCTTGSGGKCALSTCDSSPVNIADPFTYCPDAKCQEFEVPSSETTFTLHGYQDRFAGNTTWDNANPVCGGLTGSCPNNVCSYTYKIEDICGSCSAGGGGSSPSPAPTSAPGQGIPPESPSPPPPSSPSDDKDKGNPK